ncbi:Putative 4,5-dihydroxyphthalate dehydrogenase [Polystyrenella longa]|uniref:4,5-dihydroxyphthalate dehydrogenase n=1 Tax=Polystyrenella longa TaxID=2528007 RepID=A0A518CM84_9PLAN|nr:Gfo/Idh/MocA family oxidoreductase [Polystyrenella longa]QDU80337.1 Putative 4,5-dihydroxyphthalate dehydrogenase [Polystyrenella longa]
MDRRYFLKAGALSVAAASQVTATQSAKANASERLRVGVMGSGGRALGLLKTFSENPEVEVVAISDIDSRKLPQAVEEVMKRQKTRPETMKDFRKIIDDPSIDALVVGTPDHWHAIPTIMACLADKDVYVEKPDGNNIEEGQRMVAAMRKTGRIVQMGSQHRSTDRMKSAIAYAKEGHLGRCLFAKAWESAKQGNIGKPADGTPPEGVDYDFWLGSAPERPFNPVRFHGHWRWFYDYGTGDLGNDGVHRLDMAMAIMDAAAEAQGEQPLGLPRTISAAGGKWYFDDLQEFPDTLQVTYEFAGERPKILTYEMKLWVPYKYYDETEAAVIYGDQGYMVAGNRGWRAYTSGGKLVKEVAGDTHERPHVQNFVDCVKSRKKPVCDLETVGHPASVLCHSGNIAARIGRTVTLDPETETFVGDDEANALRGRPDYRKPWSLPEIS